MTTLQLIIFTALLLLLGFVLLRKHLLGPFWLRARHIQPREAVYEEISEEQAQVLLPPTFFETFAELNRVGFALVSHLLITMSKRSRMAVSLFVNREAKTMALVARIVITIRGSTRAPHAFVNFFTHFQDGSEIDTINSPAVQVFFDSPRKVGKRLPHLRDATSLFRVHQYLIGQSTSPPVLPEPGMEVDFFREQTRRELVSQAELGFHFLDETGENYRLTWRGALRSTWRLVWPVKQILQRRQESEGRRLAAAAMREK